MQILNLESGTPFTMGKGQNWRVVHPDMGSKQLTLNHGLHASGQEFTQHYHDYSEDAIVVLEGGGAIRQGDVYTPIRAGDMIFVPAGEIHGTVNTTDKQARLISFQSPPDMALYRGERDHAADKTPTPQSGHRSNVQVITMAKAGPVFGKPGDWRSVVSDDKGSEHLLVDYIQLDAGETFTHEPTTAEAIYVLTNGKAEVKADGHESTIEDRDVLFLSPGDTFSLTQLGEESAKLIYCWALGS